jgi:hypothetical protein
MLEIINGKAPFEHRNSFGSDLTSIGKLTTKPRINQGTSFFVIQWHNTASKTDARKAGTQWHMSAIFG